MADGIARLIERRAFRQLHGLKLLVEPCVLKWREASEETAFTAEIDTLLA